MRILAISSGEKSCGAICSLVKEAGEINVTPCISGSAARRLVLDEAWDLAIINYPLLDESGLELGEMIIHETDTAVIMLIKEDLIGSLGYTAEDNGIITVSKPLLPPVFRQAIRLADTSRKRLESLKLEIRRLELKIEELKLIDKAKCMLVKQNGMDEESSHRYILKLAMDKRISARDAAVNILRHFEDISS